MTESRYEGTRWRETISEWISFTRSSVVNLSIVGAITAIGWLTYTDLNREPIIIEEISTPSKLVQRGFTPRVAADRLWESIRTVQAGSGSYKSQTQLLSASRQLDVVEPGTGLSLQLMTQTLRSLFGYEQTRIAGEFICADDACTIEHVSMRLRIFKGSEVTLVSPGPNEHDSLDAYLKQAALKTLESIDPYVAAVHRFGLDNSDDHAETILKSMVVDRRESSHWAANLLGVQKQREKQHDAAIYWFRQSIDHARLHKERAFPHPWFNWGNSLQAVNRHGEAIEKFAEAAKIDPGFGSAYASWASSLYALGRKTEALKKFQRAVEVEPGLEVAWDNWRRSVGNMVREIANASGAERCEFARGPGKTYLDAADSRASEKLRTRVEEFEKACSSHE